MPPSAAGALAACLVCAAVLQGGWELREEVCWVPWPACAAALAGALLLCFASRRRGRMALACRWAAAGLVLGTMASVVWLQGWHVRDAAVRGRAASSWWMVSTSDPAQGTFGYTSTVDLRDAAEGAAVASVRATGSQALELGACVRVVGRYAPLDQSDWSRSRFMKGEIGSVKVVSVLERAPDARTPLGLVRACALQAIAPRVDDARALVAGTICGRTTELSASSSYDAFRACGLTHLVAVSGGHLAFIATLLEAVLRACGCRRSMRQLALLAVLVGYVVFTGGAPSSVRSVSMVGFASVALLGRRRAHALSGLALTVFALVVLNPGVVFDLGFQLSALSVLFMLVFAAYVQRALRVLHVPNALAEPLALSLVALWATLPITLPIFGELSLIAPLANLVVGPIMTAMLATGLVGVALATCAQGVFLAWGVPGASLAIGVPGFVFEAALWFPRALAQASIFGAQALAAVPYGHVSLEAPWWLPAVVFGGAFALYAAWPTLRPKPLVCGIGALALWVCACVVGWTMLVPPTVSVLDIGQGDAILIRQGGAAVLVDAGVDDVTRRALARNHVFHLDAVVITHWDADHWGGLPDVLQTVPVERLVVAQGAAEFMPEELRAFDLPVEEVAVGDTLSVGSFSCEMLWPEVEVSGEENDESLVVAVRYRSGAQALDVLLTGDTERDELDRYAGAAGDIDVLKMGHHGSRISVSAPALEVLDPEVAIASAGEGNSYGHPDPKSVELVKRAGAAFLCTIDAGDIHISPGESGPSVRTSR